MAYLIQQTVPFSIEIEGVDYTDAFVEFAVTDTSAFMTGMVIATGTITLGTPFTGDASANAYYRVPRFTRGDQIKVRVQYPDGTTGMHPRGWLYVLNSSYDPNSETTVLDVGDQISLRRLTDEVAPIISLAPITLEPAYQTFEGAAGAFAAKGQYLWQDSQGRLQVNNVIDADQGNIELGEWVSVRSVTALSVAPLSGSDTPPDRVEVEYETPKPDPDYEYEDDVGDDTTSEIETEYGDFLEDEEDLSTPSDEIEDDYAIRARIDTNRSYSYYYANYPATAFVRVPDEPEDPEDPNTAYGDALDSSINAAETNLQETTACGDAPEKPEGLPEPEDPDVGDSYTQTCESQWTTVKVPVYVPVRRESKNVSNFSGPGGQLSQSITTEYAMAFEVNSSYFADKFDYCRRVYRNPCLPEGSCARDGLYMIKSGMTVTSNEFGEGGQLIKSTTDRFITKLGAAIANNWRWVWDGEEIETFDNEFANYTAFELFRVSSTIREYTVEEGLNREKTTTWTSSVSRGGGVGRRGVRRRLDALDGIKTTSYTRSASYGNLSLAPPTTGKPSSIKDKNLNSAINPSAPILPPLPAFDDATDPLPTGKFGYTKKIAPPVPFVDMEAEEAKRNADYYAYVYMRSVWGDANGLGIVEYQRKDMDENWYPTRPFVYYDDVHEEMILLRMDAVSWAMGPDSSAVNINGNYICDVSGTVTIPHNLMGDAIPNLDGGEPTPPALKGDGSTGAPQYPTASVQPTGVTTVYEIDVEFNPQVDVGIYCRGGVCPIMEEGDDIISGYTIFRVFVSGQITEPGTLLTPGPNGGMPIDSRNTLVTDVNGIINPNLFAPVE